MSIKYCQKDCHQDQPVSFVLKVKSNWELCCGLCQFESNLQKQQFIPIKDLEKINKELLTKLTSSNVIDSLYNTLMNVKQWQSQIENLLLYIKSQIQNKIDSFSSLIDTLNQNIEYFVINTEKLKEVLDFRDEFKVKIDDCFNQIENLESNLANAHQILQLSSPFQKTEVETTATLIKEGLLEQQITTKSNSIINEKQSNNNTQQQIKKEVEQVSVPSTNAGNQEIKCKGKLQINQNEQYEGEIHNGMMHGKGILVKTTPYYKCIFEGNFFQNKKHGKFTETQIEIDTQELNQSFFKSLTLIKPDNQKKIQLIGEYANDKKIELFTKITFVNDSKVSQSYQFYQDDAMVSEFESD